MGIEEDGLNAVPDPAAKEDSADFSEEDIVQVRGKLSQSIQKDISNLSPQELAALGIKKSTGEVGEVTYDHGYSPDTGKVTREMHINIGKTQKSVDDPDVVIATERHEQLKAEIKRSIDAGELPNLRLPSHDDLD